MTDSVVAIEEAHGRLEARYQHLLGTSHSLARMLIDARQERDRLKEEADKVAGEAMDAALNQDVLMDEVKRLTRQRAWLLASWSVLVVATAGNAVVWWLT